MRPLRYRESHDAVDAEGSQQQRDSGEAGKKDHGKPVIGQNIVPYLLHGAWIGKSNLRIDECTAAATLFIMAAGSPAVRTPMLALGHGDCQKGTYTSGLSSRNPRMRTFCATPTICHSTGGPTPVGGISCGTNTRFRAGRRLSENDRRNSD